MFLFETGHQEVGCTIIASAIRYNTFHGFDKCVLGGSLQNFKYKEKHIE